MGLFTPNDIQNLTTLYTLQMRYLLSAENQIVDGLESMIEAASDPQLKKAFQNHLQETRQHVDRVERILAEIGGDTSDKKCSITSALISAGENVVKESQPGPARDAGLIASAQKIEHYEIASYGTARAWASLLGFSNQASMLQQTLSEEKHADQLLTSISERDNRSAAAA